MFEAHVILLYLHGTSYFYIDMVPCLCPPPPFRVGQPCGKLYKHKSYLFLTRRNELCYLCFAWTSMLGRPCSFPLITPHPPALTRMNRYLSGAGSLLMKMEVSVWRVCSMERAAAASRMRSFDAPADTVSSASASAVKPRKEGGKPSRKIDDDKVSHG